MKRMLIATLAASCLSACGSLSQAVSAYGNIAVTGAKATNDTIIEANKVALCATPVSALVRHPELVPAIRSLCLDPNDKTTPQVLDAVAGGS